MKKPRASLGGFPALTNCGFEIVKSLGVIDPKEGNVPRAVEYSRMSVVG